MESDPFNTSNRLITPSDVISIFSQLKIDYQPKDIHFYRKSFIHESYRKLKCYESYENTIGALDLQDESYERLEFIGDALIESIVANYLYDRYHIIYNQDEGFLTKLKTRLVCGKNLTFLSSQLNFQKHIVISKTIEDKYKGRDNMKDHKILCDVFEAFCGAIYQDSRDYELVRRFVISVIETYVDMLDLIIHDTNYKDQLSRYIKKTYFQYPTYTTDMIESKHKTTVWNGDSCIGTYECENKKESQQQAARLGLIYYGLLN